MGAAYFLLARSWRKGKVFRAPDEICSSIAEQHLLVVYQVAKPPVNAGSVQF